MFVIVHSGQTGVERGAHRGGMAAGFRIRGFMPARQRDELGPVPDDVAQHLEASTEGGPRGAVRANLALADAVLIVVPDATTADRFPAMDWIMRRVRGRKLPYLICDPHTTGVTMSTWANLVRPQADACHLMVTGPRATRWQPGEDVARRLVRSLVLFDD